MMVQLLLRVHHNVTNFWQASVVDENTRMFSSFVQDSIADFSKPGAKLAEVLAPEVGDAVVVPYFDVLPATSYVNDGAFPSTRLSVK
jgi:hypothetical protein